MRKKDFIVEVFDKNGFVSKVSLCPYYDKVGEGKDGELVTTKKLAKQYFEMYLKKDGQWCVISDD